MRIVRDHIKAQRQRLSQHAFFAELRPGSDLRQTLAFAPIITPWVMTFQDIIRMNAAMARDPAIKCELEQHTAEDQGHEQWFLEDMEILFGRAWRDVAWLFGSETTVVREATLAIASEVFRARDDHSRLILVEVLEATASLCFERIHEVVRASDYASRLKYFGRAHEQAERQHKMMNDVAAPHADEPHLPDAARTEALALVDRFFEAFARILGATHQRMSRLAQPAER